MNIASASLEDIRARMGASASTDDARRMLEILRAGDIADTDDVSDADWFELVASACNPHPDDVQNWLRREGRSPHDAISDADVQLMEMDRTINSHKWSA